MIYAIIGIVLGIVLGFVVALPIPLEFTRYTAVIIIGMLDAFFGALRAEVTKDRYNSLIFITGFLFNILLAVGITFLGDKLGLDLYLAATFVFTFRIFSNVGIIRRGIVQKFIEKKTSIRAKHVLTDILD
ncbi:MAG: Small basic protein [Candidatus Peregrinibacteria bacterium GW2011_GWA2_47_7]|nr:MAG: Small basic protein [Candidatus Peregrinibacteria bacterium GW2011_GWA2_47_7]